MSRMEEDEIVFDKFVDTVILSGGFQPLRKYKVDKYFDTHFDCTMKSKLSLVEANKIKDKLELLSKNKPYTSYEIRPDKEKGE